MKYACEKCLDDPCMCGHSYRDWTDDARLTLAAAVLGIKIKPLVLRRSALEPPPDFGDQVTGTEDYWDTVARRNEIAALARELYIHQPVFGIDQCFDLAEEFFIKKDEWLKD